MYENARPATSMMCSFTAGLWTNRRMWNYTNLKKGIFAAREIPLLCCIVGKHGVRPDPETIKEITDWPVSADIKRLRKFLGIETYVHTYSRNYAEMTVRLSRLLKKIRSEHGLPIVSAPSKVSRKS